MKSCEIYVKSCPIALKYDKRICSSAVETSHNLQSGTILTYWPTRDQ